MSNGLSGMAWLAAGASLLAACSSGTGSQKGMEKKPAPASAAPAKAAPAKAEPAKATVKSDPIVIDNHDAAGRFTTKGDWNIDEAGGDWAGTYGHWTTPWGDASARWEAKLPSGGNWKVYIWYGDDPNDDHATDASYTVETADGPKTAKANQKEKQRQWNLLGTYRFEAGKAACVVLTNKANGNVLADAVKFVAE